MINQRHDNEGLVVQLPAGKCKYYCLFLVHLPSVYYLFKQSISNGFLSHVVILYYLVDISAFLKEDKLILNLYLSHIRLHCIKQDGDCRNRPATPEYF